METTLSAKKIGIRDLFPCRSFMTLLTANLISRFGDSLDSIAFGWMIYVLTGSKLLLGTILAVNALPNILFSPFAGVFVDRLKKKTVIVFGYIGRGFLVSLTAFLFFTSLLQPWHLFILTFVSSTLETFTTPALTSAMPLLLPKELFLTANSFSSSAYQTAELLGLIAAGSLIAVFGISGAIFIDGATFFIAAILIFSITLQGDIKSEEVLTSNNYFSELKEGFSFIKNNTMIITTILLFAAINFCLAPVTVLMPAFVKENLKGGPQMLSVLGMCLTVGMILGGLLTGQFGSRFKISTLTIVGFVFLGLNLSLLFIPGNIITSTTPASVLSSICFGLIGISMPVVSSPIRAYFLTITPKEILGRVSAVMGMICCCAIPLSSSLTGVISQYVSTPAAFLSLGLLICLISLSLIFNKKFRSA